MQKTGRKSIVTEIVINNSSNPNSNFVVKVQANKNYGICNITLGTNVCNEVLTTFQGRQYNDPYVMEHLTNVLKEILNSHE